MSEHGEYTGTFQWFDRFGHPRLVDVYADRGADARVWAYARGDDGTPVLVAGVGREGNFVRLVASRAVTYGLDTAAAWNDLFEICRKAHRARS
jgi:hypothetical protein